MSIATFARARFAYWGTRLGIVASLLAAYLAANGAAVEKAIDAIVPEPYRPLASIVVGLATFLLVHAAQTSDVKKAGQ